MIDDKIKQYFLGQLESTDAEKLEEEIASDNAMTEQALIVEGEMIDEYAQGLLSPTERKMFEDNYLVTDARRQKLRSSCLFLNQIALRSAAKKRPEHGAGVVQGFLAGLRLSHALAFASIALLLGAAALVWLSHGNDREIADLRDKNVIPANEPTVAPVSTSTPFENQPVNQTNNGNNNVPPRTPTTLPKLGPTLASYTLAPGTLRSAGEQFIKIGPAITTVTLRLTLPPDAPKYRSFTLTVKTANGQTISTVSDLRSPAITLPANKLNDETHVVFLEGTASNRPSESIAEYTFRVRR